MQARFFSGPVFLLVLVVFLFLSAAEAQENIDALETRLKANPNDKTVLMELGRAYYDRGVAGDEDAVDRGFELFDRAFKLDSANAVALAYRGSLWTLRARDAWWPPNKTNYLRNGSEDLDAAVSMDPSNVMVRMLRGIHALGLPEYFGKLPKALEDFIVIMRQQDFPEQRKEFKVVVFYYAGVACKRADDYEKAAELFRQALSVYPESEYARKAAAELKDMGS